MDLNDPAFDALTKGFAGGGILTVLAAVAWKKILEFRQDKRDDRAGQISANAFTNIVKGLNDEIDRVNEVLTTVRTENKALSKELSEEIRMRFAAERKLEAAQKGVAETATAVQVVQEAVHEATAAATHATAVVDGPASVLAGKMLNDRIAELTEELNSLKGKK